MGAAFHVLFLLFGAFSILSQTVVLREYLVVYGGSEIALGLFFCTWLLWVGTGALVAGRLVRRLDARRAFLVAALAYGLTPLLQTTLIRSMRLLAGVPAMEVFPLDRLALATLATNLPLSFLTGALFTLGATIAARRGGAQRAVTIVYLLEALGGFAGGASATLLVHLQVGPVHILLGASAVLAAGVLAAALPGRRLTAAASGVLGLASVAALATPLGAGLERALLEQRWRTTLPGAELVDSIDTPYRNVSLARLDEQSVLLFDGRVVEAFPAVQDPVEDAALVMSQSRGARRILVIGTAVGLIRELLEYDVDEIVLVEADDRMLDRLRTFVPKADGAALSDPRVEIRNVDPRVYVAGGVPRFDAVLVRVPDPDTAQTNRLFTEEFFRDVRTTLLPGGVFSTRITSAENTLGGEVERYGRSIFSTLARVFPQVVVTPGERCVLMAAPGPGTLTDDPAALAARFRDLGSNGSRFQPETFHSIMEPGRVAFVRQIYERAARPGEPALLNTDGRPVAYLTQLMVLGRTLDSRVPEVLDALWAAGAWIALVPLLVLLALRARHLVLFPAAGGPGAFNAAALAAMAGFVSISLDLVLLQAYQSRFGTLFLQVGLMNALFMAGLALGAMGFMMLAVRTDRGLDAVPLVVAMMALVPAALPSILSTGPAREAFALLFLGCGLLAGAAFPAAASLHARAPGSSLAALLESADHWGGALGGLCAGLVLLPVLGAATTCAVLAACALGILLLVLHQRARAAAPGLAPLLARVRAARTSFPWHGLTALLAGIVIASLALGWIVRARTDVPRVRFSQEELLAATGREATSEASRPFLHYRFEDEGLALSSMTVAGDVKGYAGPVNLLLAIDADGVIRNVRLVESDETPAYIEGIGSWLGASFEGRTIARDFYLRTGPDDGDAHGVDALTGATVTSRAVVETVNLSKNAAAGLLGVTVEKVPPAPLWPRLADPAVVYLLAAFLLAVVLYLSGSRISSPWPRRAFLAANLVLGGFVFNTQLSMDHVAQLLRLEFPAPANAELFVLMAGAGLLALAFGPLYCGSLCPFGAAQELLSLAGLNVRPSARLERRTRYLRYVVLAACVSGWTITGSEALLAADPLQHAFAGRWTGTALVLVVPALALSLFLHRFWCRTFCPVGALLALGGRIGLALGVAPRKRYDLCDLGAVRERDAECLHCNRCLTGSTLTQERLQARAVRFPRATVDRWAVIAIGAVGILLAGTVLLTDPAVPVASSPGTGTARDVDLERIRSLIEENRLSGQEALYWESLDPDRETPDEDLGPGLHRRGP
jgi:spermidine synthase